jgi:hypothetical protein
MITINHELVEIVKGNFVAEHFLAAVSIICCTGTFFVQEKLAKKLLAIACSAGLSLPAYFLIYAAVMSSEPIQLWNLLWGSIMVLVFSPTSLFLIVILPRLGDIRYYRVWAGVAAVSTVVSWGGMGWLIYWAKS